MEANKLVENIVAILSKHKAEDVISINVTGKTDIADFYVVASGRSMPHTRALIEHVDEEMDKIGIKPLRCEGVREGRWAVIDYGDVIVHIFNDESRLFYHLEQLWDDGKNIVKY